MAVVRTGFMLLGIEIMELQTISIKWRIEWSI